jgi:hypothetical protein
MVRRILTLVAVAVSALIASPLTATLTINPPQPITRQVTVQLIQTALDNGLSPATVFGNTTQRAGIEAGIDTIWSQAGIDISFLPTVTRYNNTFAYQGSVSPRPSDADIIAILANAANAGKLNSDPLTLNMIMVNVVPGQSLLGGGFVAGYSAVGSNGITAFVGVNLLTSSIGIDSIASVMAHEIGHNLGLVHIDSGTPNLMNPAPTTQLLTSSQITTARLSSFARTYSPPSVSGDYNNNGLVDAADYVVWRKGGPLQNDPTTGVSAADYTFWRSRFGSITGSGAGDGLSGAAIPEPNALLLLCIAAPGIFARRRQSFR